MPRWKVDKEADAKTQIAQRIFHALMTDAMVNAAVAANDQEAHSRRMTKLQQKEEAEKENKQSKKGDGDDDGPEEGEMTNEDDNSLSKETNKSSATAAGGNPSNNLITSTYSANPLIRCLVCNRHVASNRYAPHLAKCMGLGSNASNKNSSSGLKRKAANNSSKMDTEVGRIGSPSASSTASSPSSSSLAGKMRGRPPKYGGLNGRSTPSARSTATPGP
ncbi:unnamed protein product [Sympodiomycopsis kandeliae]